MGVSLDYLVFGTLQTENVPNRELDLTQVKEARASLCDERLLSSLETDLVAMFRLLPTVEKEGVFDMVHLKYKNTNVTLRKRVIPSSGHMPVRTMGKAAPPKTVRLVTEPLDFFTHMIKN